MAVIAAAHGVTLRNHHGVTVAAAILLALLAGALAALVGPLALLPLGAVIALYAVVRLPGVILGCYLLIPFYKASAQPFAPIDLTVALAIASILSLLSGFALRERARIDRSGVALWFLLTMLVGVGTLYARDQAVALETSVRWVALVALPLLLVVRLRANDSALHQLLWTLFGFGCLMVIVGLTALGAERLAVFGTTTIGVARATLLVPVLAIAFVVRQRSRWLRWIAIVMTPLAIVVAVATGSRGPLLALVVVAAAYLVAHGGRHPIRVVAAMAALVVSTAVVLLVFEIPELSSARIGGLVSAVSSGDSAPIVDSSASTRIELYRLALGAFGDSPLIGLGTDAFRAQVGLVSYDYPHNLVLEVAADFGVLGLVLVAAVLLRAFRRSLMGGLGAPGALLLFFVVNAMVSGTLYDDRMLWALVLLPLLSTPDPRGHDAGPLE